MAFIQGTHLFRSLNPDPAYVQDWIAKWVPFFTDRDHGGVPSLVLAALQNSISMVCQSYGAHSDIIDLCRLALANLDAHESINRNEPESGPTSIPPLAGLEANHAELRLTVTRDLATSLWMLGEERACASHIREAIALLDEILTTQDRAADPMEWAITQSSRARAYKELYLVERDIEILRLSLSAYDQTVATLPEGIDSPWHQQVPGKREMVRDMLKQATQPRHPGS